MFSQAHNSLLTSRIRIEVDAVDQTVGFKGPQAGRQQ